MRSRWAVDPYAYGAMSYLPVGAMPALREALIEPVEDRVFFAGEATDPERPGTVLGAFDSGRRAAAALLDVAGSGERIAVIGAGAAGAVAARVLADAGHTVTVLEARERLGGRIHSVVDDAWPLPVQLGAWLSAEGDAAAIRERLRALGLDEIRFDAATGWSEEGAVATVDGARLQEAIARAQEQPADVALTDALEEDGADADDPALAAALAWLEAITGADATRASSWYPPAFPGEALIGANGDMAALIEETTEDLDITLATTVVRIAYDDRGVSLRLGTGEALSYDRVIVTAPLGVLQHEGIQFSPPLPFSHRGAIAELASGAVECVWMRFEEQFWDTDATIWHVVGGDGLIRTWLNLQPAVGEPVLVGLVGGAAAEEFADLNDREAQAAAQASLAFFAADED